jgi:hypothetical protein
VFGNQQACQVLSAPPEVTIEIEDIRAEIARLSALLGE